MLAVKEDQVRVPMDDGTSLEVRETGRGPALLLVHGFGGAKEDFADHVDALAARHRVVVFDHRGHGQSDGPDEVAAYSLDRLADDTIQVADALGIGRFRLLGHSMGGMVARRLLLVHPERVEALVLMDTSPGPVPGIDRDLVDLGASIAIEQGKDTLKPLLDEAAALETPSYQRLLLDRPGYQEFVDYKWAALSSVMWGAIARDIVHQPDQLTRLADVACPTLVIVGEQDEPFLEVSKVMAATIPDARLVVVPDAGHSPQFENPAVWLDALDKFLHEVDAPAARETV
jgi:2-succinyl-6-hydroxy-2,4-cyclohexadiene-1-carboxylate synthase